MVLKTDACDTVKTLMKELLHPKVKFTFENDVNTVAENMTGISHNDDLCVDLEDRLGDLGIPVGYGFSFGHITDQVTLPVGIEAEMDAEKMTYRLLEPCVC